MKKRILVTGGAGFLGSHLCEKLLVQGHEVLCAGNSAESKNKNIEHLMGKKGFEYLRHDITSPLSLDVDQIYNLAALASPNRYMSDPVNTVKTSVLGAINMLDLAHRTGARILQSSTGEVYGDPDVHPQPESCWGRVNPWGIRASYEEGKRCAETLFYSYHQQYDLNIKVARLFNTYGPRMHLEDGRVVSNFIVNALRNEPITVYGDGTQVRSFCYVDDIIGGLVDLMESPGDVTGPVNLGNPEGISVLQLAETVISLTGSASEISHQAMLAEDAMQRIPDISLAISALGWRPNTDLETGLGNTIDYFRQLL